LQRGSPPHPGHEGTSRSLSAVIDTNILVRHLTGDPPSQARRATDFLAEADELLLTDVVAAEIVYVLESFYEVERPRVAELMRAIVGFPSMIVLDAALLLRALEIYEVDRLDFAEAYLVASAEASGVGVVASFDRSIDRVPTVRRIEPA
jgi:predicted nucleic acid-binding protein